MLQVFRPSPFFIAIEIHTHVYHFNFSQVKEKELSVRKRSLRSFHNRKVSRLLDLFWNSCKGNEEMLPTKMLRLLNGINEVVRFFPRRLYFFFSFFLSVFFSFAVSFFIILILWFFSIRWISSHCQCWNVLKCEMACWILRILINF